MADKYFFLFLSVCALVGGSVWVTSEITKPRLTDPMAQRIWAAGHTNTALSSAEAIELLKKTLETQSDSVRSK